jgi:hypothetical protein
MSETEETITEAPPAPKPPASEEYPRPVAEEDYARDIPGYDPREDKGPERWEDQYAVKQDPSILSADEVPLEDSRKDETSVLASDIFDSEGNRVE